MVYLAFELGEANWKLGFTTGFGQRPRERTIPARDIAAMCREIAYAKRRLRLPAAAEVCSCYEAGREGFWLHRYLLAQGIKNLVVDSSSIEVKRRFRRAKSDRLDLASLLRMLIRYCSGEEQVWSVVRVPTVTEEDRRQLHREMGTLKRERTRITNRIKGLLAAQGVRLKITRDFASKLEGVRLWDGSPLPPALCARLKREWEKHRFLTKQIYLLEREQRRLLRTPTDPALEMVRQLMTLRGIGMNCAWLFVMEFFAWREFQCGREIGALAGLTPTPFQSGNEEREQGIAKAGNSQVRRMAIEIAWGWLRHQPESALSRWYDARFGGASKRVRRIGIVALARKLLVELWQYLETGAIPEGARLKI
jgi:transposase